MSRLSISELLEVAKQAGVLQLMARRRSRRVVVDYVPARESMAIPREDDDPDEPLSPNPPTVTSLVFTLEDAMFGGTVFVALTCGGRVLVNPFAWVNYAHLGQLTIGR